jgi:hypothetical protein
MKKCSLLANKVFKQDLFKNKVQFAEPKSGYGAM